MTQIIKKFALLALPVALTYTQTMAAPLVSIGDSVDLFFRGSISGQYRSNVFNSPTKQGDYLGILSPGLELNVGRNSNANIKIVFREDFYLYNDFSGLDTNLSNVFVDGIYNSGPLATVAGFSYVQRQQNTAGTGGVVAATNGNLVRTDNYNAFVGAEYDFSPKTYGDLTVRWNRVDYTNNDQFGNSFSDYDTFTTPLNVYYRYSPKLGIGGGYRFRYTDVDGNANTAVVSARNPGDYTDHFLSLAVDGELLPKLTTRLNIGAQLRDFSNNQLSSLPSSDTTFSMLSVFDYEYSPKLDLTAGFDRDFGTGAIGQSTITTGGFFGARYTFNDFISSNARITVNNTDYEGDPRGRNDDTIRANAAVTYTPNIYLQFTLGYAYINNESNINGASFMGHTVDLTASLRY